MSEETKKKNFTAGQFITAAVFLTIIMGFTVAGIFSPDREFSEMENRTLQKFPEFTFERLKEGKFTGEIEQYMNDQIFLKDELVTLKTACDTTLGRDYLNGVYLCDDGVYLQDFQLNEEQIKKNVGCLNEFAKTVEGQAECTMLCVPNAIYFMKDKLPANAPTDDQGKAVQIISDELSDDIRFVCPEAELSYSGEHYGYYRTDHHWTTDSANMSFQRLMKEMGEQTAEAEYDEGYLNKFYGTLYSKAPKFNAESDRIVLPIQKNNDITVRYIVTAGDHTPPEDCTEVDGILTRERLYDMSKANTKDKYATIMGGNFGLCEIESEGAKSSQRVLIVKDSYANAMLPYLCSQYKHITVADLRYYHMQETSLSDYVKENGIEKVIFLYNVDFINSDNNFIWLE